MKRTTKGLLFVVAILLTALGGWIGFELYTDNLHEIVSGEAYRAGQMDGAELAACIDRLRIRSILNLRGTNPAAVWYREEIGRASGMGVTHYDLSWSSRQELTPGQVDELVAILQQAPKPILIHCSGGADRTSLASAIYRYAIKGEPPEEAAREFSPWYGHLPWLWPRVRAMDRTFWRYATNAAPGHS